MADEKKDGGPAFPFAWPIPRPSIDEHGRPVVEVNRGLSLRDYFAAKAMIGLSPQVSSRDLGTVMLTPEIAAARAYLIADAMLAQRVKP